MVPASLSYLILSEHLFATQIACCLPSINTRINCVTVMTFYLLELFLITSSRCSLENHGQSNANLGHAWLIDFSRYVAVLSLSLVFAIQFLVQFQT